MCEDLRSDREKRKAKKEMENLAVIDTFCTLLYGVRQAVSGKNGRQLGCIWYIVRYTIHDSRSRMKHQSEDGGVGRYVWYSAGREAYGALRTE